MARGGHRGSGQKAGSAPHDTWRCPGGGRVASWRGSDRVAWAARAVTTLKPRDDLLRAVVGGTRRMKSDTRLRNDLVWNKVHQGGLLIGHYAIDAKLDQIIVLDPRGRETTRQRAGDDEARARTILSEIAPR